MRRYLRLSAALCLAAAPTLSAQLAPLGVPRGTLRFDIGGAFESADHRLLGGTTQDYLADFGSTALGSDRVPLFAVGDSLLALALGQPGYRLNLGAVHAHGQLTVGTANLGIALGLTRRLTIFGNLPLVTTRVQANIAVDSSHWVPPGGDAGFNPAINNAAVQLQAGQFFSDFQAALNQLNQRINSGVYTNPADLARARALAARGAVVHDALETATLDPQLASRLLPTSTSATGQRLLSEIRDIQDTLGSLGVSFDTLSVPVLATGRLTTADFLNFLSDPNGPIAVLPPGETKISRPGDMDVGVVYTLVDRFDRPGRTGGFRLAAEGLVRLPTGQLDNPDNLLDVGTGNGRYEVGLSGTADFGSGRLGARLTGGYLLRLPSLRVRRVTAPGQPYSEVTLRTNLKFDAGDQLALGARPFYRLARNLALVGSVDWVRRGADDATYFGAGDAIPGIDASIVGRGTASTAWIAGGGLSYVGRAAHECETGHRCGWPIDASWRYTTVVAASGGRVTKFRSTSFEIRWYQRLW